VLRTFTPSLFSDDTSRVNSATGASSGRRNGSAALVLFLLFLANLLNFFDRTLPAVYTEPIKHEWSLSDLQLGAAASAFTVIYAIAGVPLGRASDAWPRRKVLAACLLVWSGFTAATALAWSYTSLFWIRIGVGIGEAGCAPASSSIIGDLFPPAKRSRAMGNFMLGLPLGLVAAFFGGAFLIRALHSWRTPFYVAAIPGAIVAVAILFIREPERGHADGVLLAAKPVERPILKILRIPTMWWIILSGISVNFAAYAGNGFMVSLLQRYFKLPIVEAANTAGCIAGVTGLLGLTFGGFMADRIHRRSPKGRLVFGAVCLLVAAPATYLALSQPRESMWAFAVLFGIGWLLYYSYYNTTYAALQDVIEPRLRATAIAIYFACMYVLGGSSGPTVVGGLSDKLARRAMQAAGATELTPDFRAIGLHDALVLIPAMFLVTGVAMLLASMTFAKDAEKMQREIAGAGTAPGGVVGPGGEKAEAA